MIRLVWHSIMHVPTHAHTYICMYASHEHCSPVDWVHSVDRCSCWSNGREISIVVAALAFLCLCSYTSSSSLHSYTGGDVWVLVRRLQLLTGKLWWLCSVTSVLNLWQSSSALFQLKTGIGLTGSIGMRISECRNGPWKFAKSYNSSNHKQVRVL